MWSNLPCSTTPEQERAGYEVGRVETGGGEGDDVFEDSRGSNIDEGEKSGDDGDDGGCDHGDRAAALDLEKVCLSAQLGLW